jgi:hypothetical protein
MAELCISSDAVSPGNLRGRDRFGHTAHGVCARCDGRTRRTPQTLSSALRMVLVINIPASLGRIFLSRPIYRSDLRAWKI